MVGSYDYFLFFFPRGLKVEAGFAVEKVKLPGNFSFVLGVNFYSLYFFARENEKLPHDIGLFIRNRFPPTFLILNQFIGSQNFQHDAGLSRMDLEFGYQIHIILSIFCS